MMSLFNEILQFAVGTREKLSRIPTSKDWSIAYEQAVEQTVVGVCFYGIELVYLVGNIHANAVSVFAEILSVFPLPDCQRIIMKPCFPVEHENLTDIFCCVLLCQSHVLLSFSWIVLIHFSNSGSGSSSRVIKPSRKIPRRTAT